MHVNFIESSSNSSGTHSGTLAYISSIQWMQSYCISYRIDVHVNGIILRDETAEPISFYSIITLHFSSRIRLSFNQNMSGLSATMPNDKKYFRSTTCGQWFYVSKDFPYAEQARVVIFLTAPNMRRFQKIHLLHSARNRLCVCVRG